MAQVVVLDEHYIHPRLARLYDIDSPWSRDRDFYFALADRPGMAILDLGCGTGLLANAYARAGHRVTGVDPAGAMLAVARGNDAEGCVEWVQSPAQSYKSDKRFDLIVMTGHAFQAVLDDADINGTLAAMAHHLKPDGRVVFESRNPAIDWPSRWNYEMSFATPEGEVHEARRFLDMAGGRMRFDLLYYFPNETLVSQSELRFLSRDEITARLKVAGLEVHQLYGDWDGSTFAEETSPEMIFIARKAS